MYHEGTEQTILLENHLCRGFFHDPEFTWLECFCQVQLFGLSDLQSCLTTDIFYDSGIWQNLDILTSLFGGKL